MSAITTTRPREDTSQSSGQLQRPSSITNTLFRVMCGVMGWSCMRYGHSDTNHLKSLPSRRYVRIMHRYTPVFYIYLYKNLSYVYACNDHLKNLPLRRYI